MYKKSIPSTRWAPPSLAALIVALGCMVVMACSSSVPAATPAPTAVIIEKEVVKTIEVEKPVVQEVIKEVVREVPREVIVEKQVVKTIEVEVEKPVIKEVVRTVEVEKPVEVIREVVKTVEVEKPIEVVKTVEVMVTPTPPPPAPTPTPHPPTRTVMDDVGQQVEIPYNPQRIAVTNSWMVETLMACGHAPVARPRIPSEFVYPPEAYDIPVVAVSHSAGPNLEQLAAARPDLVITSPTYGRFAPAIGQALRVPVLVYDVDTVEDIFTKIETLGEIAGCSENAESAVADLRAKVAHQREGLPAEGPSVFGLFGTSESFLGFTSASYLGDMVNKLGGSMITDGEEPYLYRGIPNHAYTPFSLEKVVEKDPDVILVVRHGDPNEAREENFSGLFENPAWAGLTAVQNGQVYELSEWLYLRYPGPRAAWAMQELRPLLYPASDGG